MAGITQGQPEVAVGEPIRFGDIDGFELEQHPVSDRLVIRDTENGTVAYVRAERGGQIGGDGVLIKALKESKPMADTGRTYATIQEAEREATGWVFVPPETYNESVEITTQGLTLQGCGYNTLIDGDKNSDAITISSSDVTIKNISVQSTAGGENSVNGINSDSEADNLTVHSVTVRNSDQYGIYTSGDSTTLNNCVVEASGGSGIYGDGIENIFSGCVVKSGVGYHGIYISNDNTIVSNCVVDSVQETGINSRRDSQIVVGNRVINSGNNGIFVLQDNNIIANNRVSDSANADINDMGSNNLLDGNLTGASN